MYNLSTVFRKLSLLLSSEDSYWEMHLSCAPEGGKNKLFCFVCTVVEGKCPKEECPWMPYIVVEDL
jgi:hypothetical protein